MLTLVPPLARLDQVKTALVGPIRDGLILDVSCVELAGVVHNLIEHLALIERMQQ
jgi:hypothetical protein